MNGTSQRERETPLEQRYLEVAALLRPGEWSTYGDVSEAIRGDKLAARAVGRAILKFGVSPYPRLLRHGGRLLANYRPRALADAGPNQSAAPDELRRRFEADGVQFIDGRADPGRYVDAKRAENARADETQPRLTRRSGWLEGQFQPGSSLS